MAMRRHASNQRGTTIVEVAVGLAVGAVLVAGILTLMQQAQKNYMHTSEAADLQQNMRVGMDRLTRLIQAAGVNPLNRKYGGVQNNDPAFTAFREAGRNCIRLYADLNGDGDLNVGGQAEEADENVYFHWTTVGGEALTEQRGTNAGQPDAGAAWVSIGTGTQNLADGLVGTGTIFRYFSGPNDSVGSPGDELVPPPPDTSYACQTLTPADRARIARVEVTLRGRSTIGQDTLNKTLISDARPRNVP
ncbi:MAG TPA: hypothetical protein VIB60_03295 [Methylomirabilota bacterium]|jgi:type II secretory pathway component PulJ